MLSTPSVALQLAVKELVRMAGIAREMTCKAKAALLSDKPSTGTEDVNAQGERVGKDFLMPYRTSERTA